MARGDLSMNRILGASSHALDERADLDLYVTPPMMVYELDRKLKENGFEIAQNVWEPAVGKKHISNKIRELYPNINIKESDIINRGDDTIEELDFLKYDGEKFDGDIITNPPYKFANDFYKKSCESITDGHWVWMFVKIQFLETQARYELFQKYRPNVILACARRTECGKDGKLKDDWGTGGIVMYCWVGHQVGTGSNHPTYFDWINTEKHQDKENGESLF